MPDTGLFVFVFIIALALAYAYSNGINDAANAIATVIGTRVMPPLAAIAMGATLNLVGTLTGTKVAKTIGKGIAVPEAINEYTVMAAILSSVIWVLGATRFGVPVSVSHSLVASLVGAAVATGGMDAVVGSGVIKVMIALAISPFAGFILAFAAMVGLYWLTKRAGPTGVRRVFSRLQLVSAAFMAYSHGKNDAQNAMGVMALAAALYFGHTEINVDLWMILLSAFAIGMGTALGGWKVIRTLGLRITKLEPVHGFAASTAGATVIEIASNIGLPVSTTHTVSGSIIGVGATRRLSAVRWGVTQSIVLAWLVTYPVCFVLGLVFSFIFEVAFV